MSDGEQRKKSSKTVLIVVLVILAALAAFVVFPGDTKDIYQNEDQGGGIAKIPEARSIETQPETISDIKTSLLSSQKLSPFETVKAFEFALQNGNYKEAKQYLSPVSIEKIKEFEGHNDIERYLKYQRSKVFIEEIEPLSIEEIPGYDLIRVTVMIRYDANVYTERNVFPVSYRLEKVNDVWKIRYLTLL